MTRTQLTDQIVELAAASGLGQGEKLSALAIARAQIVMGGSVVDERVTQFHNRKRQALTRPGGGLMGKQKREPKEK